MWPSFTQTQHNTLTDPAAQRNPPTWVPSLTGPKGPSTKLLVLVLSRPTCLAASLLSESTIIGTLPKSEPSPRHVRNLSLATPGTCTLETTRVGLPFLPSYLTVSMGLLKQISLPLPFKQIESIPFTVGPLLINNTRPTAHDNRPSHPLTHTPPHWAPALPCTSGLAPGLTDEPWTRVRPGDASMRNTDGPSGTVEVTWYVDRLCAAVRQAKTSPSHGLGGSGVTLLKPAKTNPYVPPYVPTPTIDEEA